jgi:cytochrome c556
VLRRRGAPPEDARYLEGDFVKPRQVADCPWAYRPLLLSAMALLAVLLAAGTSLAMNGAEIVQTRRSLFGEMTDALKYIANHWDDSASYGDLAQAASLIARDAKTLPKLFPPGTGQSDGLRTAAADSIWTDKAGFDHLAGLLAAQAGKLAKTTVATDSGQVKSEIKVVIATCKSCHRDYRSN